MGKKTVLDVKVKDVEKRRFPTKHYVYVLEVNWSEGSSTVVYRRYSDFFEFQCFLLEMFPTEGGAKDPSQRMIPFLPGKKLFGRSHIRAVAEKRREKIDEYCRTLIRLPPYISDCQFVLEFFEVRQTDLEKPQKPQKTMKGQPKINEISDPLILERYVAIADYEKQKKNECSVAAGQTVEVIDKNENGWWFVNVDDFHEGWVPATYLEPLYGSEDIAVQKLDQGEEETWISINKYEAKHHDELGFEKGVLLEVFEKGIDGWFKVRYQGKEGMAPAAYLKQYHGQGAGQASTGAEVVSTMKDATLSASVVVKPTKPPSVHARSATLASPPTSPDPPSPSSKTASTSLANSHTHSVTSPEDSQKSLAMASLASSLMAGRSGSSHTPSVSGPKSASSSEAAAALPGEQKQTFAPTWHSQAKQTVDEEPIYGPTPRRYAFKKPPLQKRDVSSSSSAFPEPVYEIIPEPEEEIYLTIGDFVASAGDGISFSAGKECKVVTKNSAGWWYVEMEGEEGWVPSSYLERKLTSPTKPHPVSPPAFSLPNKKALLTKKEPIKEQRQEPMAKREEAKKEPPRPPREPKEPHQRLPRKDISPPRPPKVHLPKERKEPLTKTSPHQPRRLSLTAKSSSASSVEAEKRPSLRRSTSTDSGLYEEVGIKKPKENYLHSPPPVKRNAPPKPSRPKNAPTLPNSIAASKSPRPDRKSLKASISVPMPYQPSPNTRRKSEQEPPTSRNMKSISGSRSPAMKPARPQVKRGGNDELSNSWSVPRRGTNDIDSGGRHVKKNSSPEIKLGAMQEVGRKNTQSPRPVPHARRSSTEGGTSAAAYKLELAKKLSGKSGAAQPPKRPSPPNRPKAPPGGRNAATLGSRAQAGPPARPQPPGKRPPPPRPGGSPATVAKKTVYVTIGGYSGGDAGVCLHFKDGEEVEVMEKSSDGWWFVKMGDKEGWAPSTYIEERQRPATGSSSGRPPPSRAKPPPPSNTAAPPVASRKPPEPEEPDSAPKPKPRPRPRKSTAAFYRASESYDVPAYEDSGMPLVKGRVYELKEKSDNGWWLMKDGDTDGWAPASHFKPA